MVTGSPQASNGGFETALVIEFKSIKDPSVCEITRFGALAGLLQNCDTGEGSFFGVFLSAVMEVCRGAEFGFTKPRLGVPRARTVRLHASRGALVPGEPYPTYLDCTLA